MKITRSTTLTVDVQCWKCGEDLEDVALKQKYGDNYEIYVEPHQCKKEEEDED